MSHSTEIEGWMFHHNGDYSGDVTIIEPDEHVPAVVVPFTVLAEFVAGYVVGEKIAALENASTLDVLLGKV